MNTSELEENIKTYKNDIPEKELLWQKENTDQIIKILDGKGWKIQFENTQPISIKPGEEIIIPAKKYHRLIKKSSINTNLKIQHIEFD